jgi:hypothetical protein
MHGQRGIEIIDLEKDRVTINLKRTKVMFFIWVVDMAEIVVDANCLHDAGDCFRRPLREAQRRRRCAGSKQPRFAIRGTSTAGATSPANRHTSHGKEGGDTPKAAANEWSAAAVVPSVSP